MPRTVSMQQALGEKHVRGFISGFGETTEVQVVDYCPGNRTRYRVMFVTGAKLLQVWGLNEEDSRSAGALSVLGFGTILVFGHTTSLELLRALRCAQDDAAVLFDLVRWFFGDEVDQTVETTTVQSNGAHGQIISLSIGPAPRPRRSVRVFGAGGEWTDYYFDSLAEAQAYADLRGQLDGARVQIREIP